MYTSTDQQQKNCRSMETVALLSLISGLQRMEGTSSVHVSRHSHLEFTKSGIFLGSTLMLHSIACAQRRRWVHANSQRDGEYNSTNTISLIIIFINYNLGFVMGMVGNVMVILSNVMDLNEIDVPR